MPHTIPSTSRRSRAWVILVVAVALLLSSCGRNMYDQPKGEPNEATPFFADGSIARPLPEGTVSRERGGVDPAYFTGQGEGGMQLTELPIELNAGLLRRGQERYDIFCTPCHSYDGSGNGMVVQRGFPRPTSFQSQRLLDAPVGYYYGAITNGFGRMYSYAARIPVEERWAIAAYVKALQLSQNANADDVPADVRSDLETTEGALR